VLTVGGQPEVDGAVYEAEAGHELADPAANVGGKINGLDASVRDIHPEVDTYALQGDGRGLATGAGCDV
jgi:hypothetical protein